jgi:lipoyl(octanoyl) transferase
MRLESKLNSPLAADESALQVYLLGLVDFADALDFQRLLAYQVGGDRDQAALILCEHPPLITIGRQGSQNHVQLEPEELVVRGWSVRWVNRGGGTLLHLPGQMAIYPILPLDRLGLGIDAYVARLEAVLSAVLKDFTARSDGSNGASGVRVGGRLVADCGIAVRDWVSYYGAVLNVNPDLELLRKVRCGVPATAPMTSLERERRGPLRAALVRERLLEHFIAHFRFGRAALLFNHPSLPRKTPSDAVWVG